MSSSSFSKESPCYSDGCVISKHSQKSIVIKYIHEYDNCNNAVSWLQSLKKLNDTTFELICGIHRLRIN